MDEAGEGSGATPKKIPYGAIAQRLRAWGTASIIGCVLAYFAWFRNWPRGEPEAWGQFGDFVGGVAGTTVSLAALIALAHTLRLQADELEEARKLLDKQSAALREQSDTMQRQAFESTLFSMLRDFAAVSEPIRTPETTRHFINTVTAPARGVAEDLRAGLLRVQYDQAYTGWQQQLGPYFRMLYHVLRFIDAGPISDAAKREYASLVRARLNTHELLLLFLNCAFGTEGRDGELLPLLVKYRMLKHGASMPLEAAIEPLRFTEIARAAWGR